MASERFESLLKELSEECSLDLHPDYYDNCLIALKNGLQLTMTLDEERRLLELIIPIGHVSPGPFRKELFARALKENGRRFPRFGIFAYSDGTGEFILSERLPVARLDGKGLGDAISQLTAMAEEWRRAVETQSLPSEGGSGAGSPGLFGLIR